MALATRSKLLRDYLAEELVRQEREHKEGKLYGLYQVFRDQVFHELALKEFADAFAQMLAYGLFLARLNSGAEPVTLHNAREYVPGSFRLIRELIDFLTELERNEYRDIRWVVEEVLSIVNGLDLPAIHEDLSFRQRKSVSCKVRAADEEEHRLFERDPFIYFYEDYLKAYDPKMRKGRGVYYTPPPIVNFIIRAVDDILKQTLGIPAGLADHKRVTALDFACGTGTFLLEAFQRIFDNVGGPDSGRANLIVRDHMLKNLFGFEYLIAPYTIAHLKLSQYLRDKGHPLKENERLQIFLTNTLEPIHPEPNFFVPAVTEEAKAAQLVKEQPILVIIGNPPYSGVSRNMGAAAQKYVEPYKSVDGKPLGERKHWLQDDYVKFIAFAQSKMDQVDEGIVGVITNHNYLDGPTFRGMRQSLLGTFDGIYVLDLHGSAQRKERAPDVHDDENVFDIKPGVAVAIFIRSKRYARFVQYGELWGKRESKYKALADLALGRIEWQEVNPSSPNYVFKPQASNLESIRGYPVDQIFEIGTTALQTSRDDFAIAFTRDELMVRLNALNDTSILDEEFRHLLKARPGTGFPPGDSDFWSLKSARQELHSRSAEVAELLYRPFDVRYVIYDDAVVHRMKREVSDQMRRPNLALLLPRQLSSLEFRHVLATDVVSEMCVVSSSTKEQNRVFPLWVYDGDERHANFQSAFREYIESQFEQHVTPEEIFGYIYAILHAPSYRFQYAEVLRTKFPLIPFPTRFQNFDTLSRLGWALVQAHLLRDVPKQELAIYWGKGDHMVEAVRYSAEEKAIWINETQKFAPVPQVVWDFHIGGYRVLEKFLKSRKGRALLLEEINHVGHVADSLAFTIEQMVKIDEAYLKAFPDRG